MNAPAAKKATAKKTTDTPAAPAKSKAPAVDYSALTVQKATEADIKHTRTSKLDDTPVMGWVKESKASGEAKSVEVPKANVESVVHDLRMAARRLDVGLKVNPVPNGGDSVKIVFQAGDKKARKTKEQKTAETAATATE